MSDLLAARTQMALSLGFHIIFAVLGIGLPALMVLAERKWLKFPALIPGVHTIESAAAPYITLKLVTIGLAGGAVVLVPSLWYLFRVFKSDSTSAFERVDTAEHRAPTE